MIDFLKSTSLLLKQKCLKINNILFYFFYSWLALTDFSLDILVHNVTLSCEKKMRQTLQLNDGDSGKFG
jgi:hypothetical protein